MNGFVHTVIAVHRCFFNVLGESQVDPKQQAMRFLVLQTFLESGTPLYRLPVFTKLLAHLPEYEYEPIN